MKKKDVLLVLVVILIPIVILGAVAVAGAGNIKDSITFEGTEGCTITHTDFADPNDPNDKDETIEIHGSVEKVHIESDYTFDITVDEGFTGTPTLYVDGSDVPLKPNNSNDGPVYNYTVHIDKDPIVIKITGISPA